MNNQIIAPYFGAFGPPTVGHFEVMKMTALAHLRDFPDKQITMMWMPTAGGSKTHLYPTKYERIAALEVFNQKLREDPEFTEAVKSGNLKFEASTLEYEIFADNGLIKQEQTGKSFACGVGKGDSSSIFTLLELRKRYPKARITVTMGIDNLLDLPWWYRSYEYPQITKDIYVAQRDLPPVDKQPTKDEAANIYIELGKKVSVKKIGGLLFRAANPKYPLPLKNTVATYPENGYEDTGYSLETYIDTILPQLSVKPLGTPTGTSSSLLRCVMQKIASGETKYQRSFEKLVGIPYASAGPWMAMLDRTNNFENDKPAKCDDLLKELETRESPFSFLTGGKSRKTRQKRNRRSSRKNE